MNIVAELNRRGVVRAAAMYVAIAWGGTEILVFLLDALQGEQVSQPARKYLAILFIAGFPVAMYLSWTRDLGKRSRRFVAAGAMAAVLIAALIWISPDHGSTGGPTLADVDPQSIAVLPFVNMSSDEDNTYFSHGLSEELLNVLARIPGLKVSSRTSSFHFAGQDVPIGEIAARLAVRHVLEGSVRKSGDTVRITAQLIDAQTDAHLWSQTYDRKVLDTFEVQDEIAARIASELKLNLTEAVHARQPTSNAQAYDKYLRGWHFLRQGWGEDDYLKARDHLVDAIALDPGFAEAHALLSIVYVSLANFRYAPPAETFPLAHDSASTALALDDSLPDAHAAMGWVQLSYHFDWREAERHFRRAIALAPNSFVSFNGLSFALQAGGRLDEALDVSRQAFELDPLTIWTRSALADVYYKRREYGAALDQLLALLEIQPDDPLTLAWAGFLYAATGDEARALEVRERAMRFVGQDPNLRLYVSALHAVLGQEAAARELLDSAIAERDTGFVSPGSIALVYTQLGEYDTAIDWLGRAVQEYDSYIFNLGYPDFDALRGEPRFIALCKELRMPCGDTWGGG
jgi:TolB-like protein/Flp pilus assembly protein TadD